MQTVSGYLRQTSGIAAQGSDFTVTDLLEACKNGDLAIVQYCAPLSPSLPFTQVDHRGRVLNAFQLACQHNQLAVARWLYENCELDINQLTGDGSGHSALSLAQEAGHKEIVEFLKSKGADGLLSPLHIAARDGDLAELEKLLSRGDAALWEVSATGKNALDYACQSRHQAVIRTLVDHIVATPVTAENAADVRASRQKAISVLVKHLLHRPAEDEPGKRFWKTVNYRLKKYDGSKQAKRDNPNKLSKYFHKIQTCNNALHLAALFNDEHLVSYLLKLGVNPEKSTSDGFSAMHFAILGGSKEALKCLLGHEPTADSDAWQAAPVHMAASCSPLALQVFMEAGADIHQRDDHGLSPLDFACKYGHIANAKTLMKAGADPLEQDSNGRTALTQAASAGQARLLESVLPEVLALLPMDEPVRVVSELVVKAAMYNHWQLVESLLRMEPVDPELTSQLMKSYGGSVSLALLVQKYMKRVSSYDSGVITKAIGHPDSEAASWVRDDFQKALESGTDGLVLLYLQTPLRDELLHELHKHRELPALLYALKNPDLAVLDRVLAAGADVAVTMQPDNTTPLSYALKNKQFAAVARLLPRCSLSVCETPDALQRTALHHAVISSPRFTYELLVAGADPDKKNSYGTTPCERIEENSQTASLLTEASAVRAGEAEKAGDESADFTAALTGFYQQLCAKSALADVEQHLPEALMDNIDQCQARTGLNALHLAALMGRDDVVSLLLRQGANPLVQTLGTQSTALHLAIRSGNPKCVTLLLKYPALVNQRDGNFLSPIRLASTLEDMPVQGGILDQIWAAGIFAVSPEHTVDLDDAQKRRQLRAFNQLHRMVHCRYSAAAVRAALEQQPVQQLLNVRNERSGLTALQLAVTSGQSDLVRLLIINGGDPVVQDSEQGMTAFHLAVAHNQKEVFETLLKMYPQDQINKALAITDNNNQTVANLARSAEDRDFQKMLNRASKTTDTVSIVVP